VRPALPLVASLLLVLAGCSAPTNPGSPETPDERRVSVEKLHTGSTMSETHDATVTRYGNGTVTVVGQYVYPRIDGEPTIESVTVANDTVRVNVTVTDTEPRRASELTLMEYRLTVPYADLVENPETARVVVVHQPFGKSTVLNAMVGRDVRDRTVQRRLYRNSDSTDRHGLPIRHTPDVEIPAGNPS